MIKTPYAATIQDRLYLPFRPQEHEFVNFGRDKFTFLKEAPINRRLTEALGVFGWQITIDTQNVIVDKGQPVVTKRSDKKTSLIPLSEYLEMGGSVNDEGISIDYDHPVQTMFGSIMIYDPERGVWVRRDGAASEVRGSMGGKLSDKWANTYMTAATRLLKRLARMVGVGLYLTEIEKNNAPTTIEAVGKWVRAKYGPTSLNEAKNMLVHQSSAGKEHVADAVKTLNITEDHMLYQYSDALAQVKLHVGKSEKAA